MKRTLTLTMMLLIFGLMMQPVSIRAQYVTSSQTIGSGVNQLDISVSVYAGLSQAKFEITGPATVWFGFSFNTTVMSPGSYTILANVSGGNPAEYIMVNHAAPTLQPVQNLTNITSSVAGGRKTFVFYRALTTGDPNDHVFTASAGNLNIAWAYGSTLALGYHADRGGSSLNFINPCSTSPTTTLPAIHICQGDSVQIFGQYKTATGNYSMSYPVTWACDSIVMQPLVVHNPVSSTLPPIAICTGDSAMIFGQYQTASGNYSMTYQNAYGCDSTAVQPLVVTHGQAYVLDTIFILLCNGDSINLNGSWVTASGNHVQFAYILGCDTILDLYMITALTIDTTVVSVGSSLQAVPGYPVYNWIDCNTLQTAPGSGNSHSYTPPVPGFYLVQISAGGCVAESGCHAAGSISIDESPVAEQGIQFYPNPASDRLFVQLPSNAEHLQIIDMMGRVVFSRNTAADIENTTIDLSAINQGVYMLVIHGGEQIHSAKLIIGR